MGADPYLTTAEVAARFNVAPETVRYWRHKGTGPQGIRVGRSVLYARRSVDAWDRREHLVPEDAERLRELVDVLLATRRPEDVVSWLTERHADIAAGEWEQLLRDAGGD